MIANSKKVRIGILTFPTIASGNVPLSNLIDILSPLSSSLCLITGGIAYTIFRDDTRLRCVHNVTHKSGPSRISKIWNYFYTQVVMSYLLAMTSRKVDVWIIFLGSDALLLPILTARIIGKKVIMQRPGSALHDFKVSNHSLIKPMEILSKTSLMFSNNILLYSPRLEKEWELEKYHNKILIARRHFLDLTTFEVRKQLHERKSVIGYIGRFKEEKGIMQLIQAIPLVLRERNDLEFSLIGDGHLLTDIESHLDRYESHGKVKITKWMAHEELVSYLNELRLIVLPSYIEGLPNIMLEAMACGTPVLATSVGAIPDVIRDGETGFIMEDNTPQCIASNIIRALHNPDLDQITGNARALVEREFTYESAVERYQNILYSFDPR